MLEERLQKFLSRAGVASRRSSEDLITNGRVKVNGRIVRELGTKVNPVSDRVEVDGVIVDADSRSVYLLLNKPPRYICSLEDPEGRAVVTDLVPKVFGRVYPVGRLDWDSEGALLMTNDGELTQLLTHPRHEVEKNYLVKVTGLVDNMDARIDRLREGVVLDDGYRTLPAQVYRDSDTGLHTWFVVAIREGKNRQIRRMFETVGLDVRRLRRISYGPLVLGDLDAGDWRRLEEHEIDELYRVAGGKRATLAASRGRLNPGRAAVQSRGNELSEEARKNLRGTRPGPSIDDRSPVRRDDRVQGQGRAIERASASRRRDDEQLWPEERGTVGRSSVGEAVSRDEARRRERTGGQGRAVERTQPPRAPQARDSRGPARPDEASRRRASAPVDDFDYRELEDWSTGNRASNRSAGERGGRDSHGSGPRDGATSRDANGGRYSTAGRDGGQSPRSGSGGRPAGGRPSGSGSGGASRSSDAGRPSGGGQAPRPRKSR
jgi:23S rRNA pseudouridine2605 synthase